MPEAAPTDPQTRRRREAVETFLGALAKAARTIVLYKPGHTMIAQVVERVRSLLAAAIGEEPNLTLEVKARQILIDEAPLADLPEVTQVAVSLHSMGVGQVLITSRLDAAGLEAFMRLLMMKADEKRTLSDLQKTVSETRIDGLQIITILSFVVTGEDEESPQKLGQLSDAQLAALESAATLPDFLHLLLRQNEKLTSREAEALTGLFDQALSGELAVEDFAQQLPWGSYDARVKTRWDVLRAGLDGRSHWDRDALISELALSDRTDRKALSDRQGHEAQASFAHALGAVHGLLAKPVGERQPRFAVQAYVRLLDDMARAGRLAGLLAEYRLWKANAADPRWGAYLAALRPELEHRLPTAALAQALVERLAAAGAEPGAGDELRDFALTLGPAVMPLLVDELHRVGDKAAQKALCGLLAQLGRRLGAGALVEALKDEDYFIVVQALAVLEELGYPEMAAKAAPLVRHGHAKVRAGAVRALGRAGGPAAAKTLGDFIASGEHIEEGKLAAMALSQMSGVDAERLLIAAYRATEDYDTHVAVATALCRTATPEVEAFLRSITRQSLVQWLKGLLGRFTGAPKDLREAALHSLELVRKELHGAKG